MNSAGAFSSRAMREVYRGSVIEDGLIAGMPRYSCARHGHGPVVWKEMTGKSDNNRSEEQGGFREKLSTKEVGSKGTIVGTRTGSEAAMRAMGVRENAKSNNHRKTHRLEPDGMCANASGCGEKRHGADSTRSNDWA